MAVNMNKVFIAGNLTRDPELRHTSGGASVCNFDLAVNRKFKQGDEWKTETMFFKICVWGKSAENCAKYLTKGKGALVEGRLQNRSWEDKDGNKRISTEIVAENVQFTSGKGESSGKDESVFTDAGFSTQDDDQVPF